MIKRKAKTLRAELTPRKERPSKLDKRTRHLLREVIWAINRALDEAEKKKRK
jgi:hypothetical protein